ncbi:MAG: UDP-N-acetylglucosamine 1-carboxyvinyltransferase [Thermoflexales bacterium]|nr:UDP-N-acetylglucosamine 1-carboxyvinyltransferase [Thermoflexales bacterium]
MSEFIIEGGQRLHGEVRASGNKNAALPLITAALLTDQPVILHNVPRIADVVTLIRLIESIGASVRWTADNTVVIHAANIDARALDPRLCKDIRASILLAGPLLGRAGALALPPPGGDVIGRRRLDTHFLALRALGATLEYDGALQLRAPKGLVGTDIMLDEASVTATENAIMAAARARGTTILRNAASEPHIQDLCACLTAMGARIENAGTNTVIIHGAETLKGCEFTVGADNIEVTSFIVLGALRGDGIRIRDACVRDLRMTAMTLERIGIRFDIDGNDVVVPGGQRLEVEPDFGGSIPTIADSPWPGFPADAMSLAVVAATQSNGTVLIHEKMFESRLYFVDKLIAMGARIVLCDPHRCLVQGISRLRGEVVQSPDIRAGVALVIAALCAEGRSVIGNVGQIDRGYERFEDKLRGLGVSIERR